MSGHSKWSTIKRAKGITDAKRGQTFTKLANTITLATRLGSSGDPDSNPRLRMAIEAARTVNMPKDNIQRAIDRATGAGAGQVLEEVLYEGFGPNRVAFIVEGVTDNRLRTNQAVKNIFDRSGGSLASVAYMFDHQGEIKVKSKGGDLDEEMLELIDLGAEDVEDYEEEDSETGANIRRYLVYVESPELNTMGTKITQVGYGVESVELVYKPNTTVEINDREMAEKVINFAEKLEELDDVQKVFANFNIPEGLL